MGAQIVYGAAYCFVAAAWGVGLYCRLRDTAVCVVLGILWPAHVTFALVVEVAYFLSRPLGGGR